MKLVANISILLIKNLVRTGYKLVSMELVKNAQQCNYLQCCSNITNSKYFLFYFILFLIVFLLTTNQLQNLLQIFSKSLQGNHSPQSIYKMGEMPNDKDAIVVCFISLQLMIRLCVVSPPSFANHPLTVSPITTHTAAVPDHFNPLLLLLRLQALDYVMLRWTSLCPTSFYLYRC